MAWWAFQNIVATAILALVVTLICRVRWLSPVVRHALWVLVLIKFVTPPVMAWPWRVPDPFGIQTMTARSMADNSTAPIAEPPAPNVTDQAIEPLANPRSADAALNTSLTATPWALSAGELTGLWSVLLIVWALGAVAILFVQAVRLLRIAGDVRAAGEADPYIVQRVHALAARLDLPPVDVVAMPHATAPAMWCLGRPRLLWPEVLPAEFTDACIDGLIVHELAHIKRRDHVVGWIELAAGVVWWWNPLFWFVRSALREQAELACDGWVIAALPNGRRAYAESLLALSSAATVDVPASPVAAVFGVRARSRRALERRLVMIMKGRASRRLSVAGLVGLGMMAAATLPVWATGLQQIPPPPPPPPSAAVVAAPQIPPLPPPPPGATAAPSVAPAAQMAPAYPQGPQTPPPPSPARRPPSITTATTIAPTAVPPPSAPMAAVAGAPVMAVPQTQTTRPNVRGVPQGQTPRPATTVSTQQGATTVIARPAQGGYVMRMASVESLPADAQSQVKSYNSDRDAMQQELDRKLEAKRADLTKSLQALQDQYTKAGKLDEAVAIRDYIRSLSGEGEALRRTVIRR